MASTAVDKIGYETDHTGNVIPLGARRELIRKELKEAQDLLRENLMSAIETIADIMNGADTDDATRLKAANIILERVLGKAPQHVTIDTQDGKMADAFRVMLVPTEKQVEENDPGIVDAEVLED